MLKIILFLLTIEATLAYIGFRKVPPKKAFKHLQLIIFISLTLLSIIIFYEAVQKNNTALWFFVITYCCVCTIYYFFIINKHKHSSKEYYLYSFANKVGSPNLFNTSILTIDKKKKCICFINRSNNEEENYKFQNINIDYSFKFIPRGITLLNDDVSFKLTFPLLWKEEIERLYQEKII